MNYSIKFHILFFFLGKGPNPNRIRKIRINRQQSLRKSLQLQIQIPSNEISIKWSISRKLNLILSSRESQYRCMPKYKYFFSSLCLFFAVLCPRTHRRPSRLCTIYYIEQIFLLFFFCDSFSCFICQKTTSKQIGNFIYEFLSVVSLRFFIFLIQKARNMFISNHHPMACMLMTSQMMIFCCPPLLLFYLNKLASFPALS